MSFLTFFYHCGVPLSFSRRFFVFLEKHITAMIEYVKGPLAEKTPSYAVVECAGVAYLLHISLATYSALPQEGEPVKIFTHQIVREDAHLLFGFSDRQEREVFRKLISVSGIGAGTARTVLSSMSVKEVVAAMESGDAGAFKQVKGIGLKTAQRIILELKGKVDFTALEPGGTVAHGAGIRGEALDALEVLGFVRRNCEQAVDAILTANPSARVEDVIKLALKNL